MKPTILHVGNIPQSMSKANLVRIFTGAGKVLRATISTNEHHNLFALIEMASEKDAAMAIDYLDGRDFDGVKLTVGFADLIRHVAKQDALYQMHSAPHPLHHSPTA
jgi:RNA recognition motif-containing protein